MHSWGVKTRGQVFRASGAAKRGRLAKAICGQGRREDLPTAATAHLDSTKTQMEERSSSLTGVSQLPR